MPPSPTTLLQHGSLTFFAGPMSSGKTLELIRHLQIFQQQQIPLICLRPATDTRTSKVQSRAGLLLDGHIVEPQDLDGIRNAIHDKFVIGVDEVNFFTPELVPILVDELRKGKTILVSGIDTDFRGELFPTTRALIAIPETIIERSRAVCAVCRQHNATRTQRLRDGKPVPKDDPQILVEGSAANVTYEARCLRHHELV
jgi:thymidine kinase